MTRHASFRCMRKEASNVLPAPKITTLRLAGLSCDACVRHVAQSLYSLEGVIHVRIDNRRTEAIVEHLPSHTDAAAVVAAVRGAGYSVTSIDTVEDCCSKQRTPTASAGCCCGGGAAATDESGAPQGAS